MKCISILACILGICFVSTAWAQQPAAKPPFGKHFFHRMANQTPRAQRFTASRSSHAQANRDDSAKIWELGTYPGGTWFATWHINDLGVIVGLGDISPIDGAAGYTHTLAVPLFGPRAGEWTDFEGAELATGWEEPVADISNTGLVVSHATTQDGHVHGVAWTKAADPIDLGTLADTHDPRYASYNASYAFVTNKLGTLIGGNSGVDEWPWSAPVVWTPSNVWINGKFVTKWKIQKLDTAAFRDLAGWNVYGVNDYGQILAIGFNNDVSYIVGVLWNPRPDGKGWGKPMSLLPSPAYPSTAPYSINNKGEIVGTTLSPDQSMGLPLLWEPLNRNRTRYSKAIELPLPEGGFTNCENVGINELGDMVGDCWNDDYSLDLPARWTTKDLTFSEIINFPADWGFAWGVNNNRIASVTYLTDPSGNCSWDMYGSCGGAIQLH